jgi:hypothetical protein
VGRRIKPADRLPCDQSRIIMGSSWDPLPTEWRTRKESCSKCQAAFTVTADEQQFWYEKLRIPYIVSINHCPDCRKRLRIHKRIIARLSELIPLIKAGKADDVQKREAALTIAEGMMARIATSRTLDIPILGAKTNADRCARIITELRKASSAHDDLLPILIMMHERLNHPSKVERLQLELAQTALRSVPMKRAISYVQTWLSSPTRAARSRIIDAPRK